MFKKKKLLIKPSLLPPPPINDHNNADDIPIIPIKRSITSRKWAAITSKSTAPTTTQNNTNQIPKPIVLDHNPFANSHIKTNTITTNHVDSLAAKYQPTAPPDFMDQEFISFDYANNINKSIPKPIQSCKLGASRYVDVLLSDDPDDDASDTDQLESKSNFRDWELDQIKRGGALSDQSGLSGQAARAVHSIAREANGRLPDLLPIDSLASAQSKLTTRISDLMETTTQSLTTQVSDLQSEIDQLETGTDMDEQVHTLSMNLAQCTNLLNYMQDIHEWMLDIGSDLDTWEQDALLGKESNAGTRMMDELCDEIKDLAQVFLFMRTFKMHDMKAYRNSNACDALFMVVSTFVRIDLLTWNPISDNCRLSSRYWHKMIVHYGEEVFTNDPDSGLFRQIVDEIIVPGLRARIIHSGPTSIEIPCTDDELSTILDVRLGIIANKQALASLLSCFDELLYTLDKLDPGFQSLITTSLETASKSLQTICNDPLETAVPAVLAWDWFIEMMKQPKYRVNSTWQYSKASTALLGACKSIVECSVSKPVHQCEIARIIVASVRGTDHSLDDLGLAVRALVNSKWVLPEPDVQCLLDWMRAVGGFQLEMELLDGK